MPPHPDPTGQSFISTIHHDTYPTIAQSNQTGRAVLITGASQGIGRGIAVSFAKAGAATIIIAARSSLDEVEKEIQSAAPSSVKVVKLQLDITSKSSVNDAAKHVEEEVGRLDILINNAGYLENFAPIAESDTDKWWLSFEVNLRGTYLVTRAFLPLLLRGDHKTIVNTSSVGGHMVLPGGSAYLTAKFSIMRFTEFVATEYADQGVVALLVHPGSVQTSLALNLPKQLHFALVDTPQLAGDSLAWLTQDRKEWLSGRYISVNWDLPELVSKGGDYGGG